MRSMEQLIEGDVFKTIVPLDNLSPAKASDKPGDKLDMGDKVGDMADIRGDMGDILADIK